MRCMDVGQVFLKWNDDVACGWSAQMEANWTEADGQMEADGWMEAIVMDESMDA